MTASDSSPPAGFSGQAALFPLPNATLFPNVMLPLHIFEPRYRQMVEETLRRDRLIAIAALREDATQDYFSKTAPVHDMVCLGRIVADERLDDGRYYLLTQGLSRARLITEISTDKPYRIGQLELITDVYPVVPVINREHRQRELVQGFRSLFPDLATDASLMAALESTVPLGELCDVIAHAMKLSTGDAVQLLKQADVDQRSDIVLQFLKLQCREQGLSMPRRFPPEFSIN